MLKLIKSIFADKRVAFSIFRGLHELPEDTTVVHLNTSVTTLRLCVGINERPIDIEEMLLDQFVFVTKSQLVM